MYISMLSALIPAVIGVLVLNRVSLAIRFIIGFVICSILLQIITFIFYLNSLNNLPFFHIYTYLEFGVISIVYYLVLDTYHKRRILLLFLIVGFVIFSIINLVKWENIFTYNSNQRLAEFLVVFVFIIVYMTTILRTRSQGNIENQPYSVLSFGFLVYFTGTLLLFLNASNLMNLGIKNDWVLHSILNIFINIVYFIVIWMSSRRIIHS